MDAKERLEIIRAKCRPRVDDRPVTNRKGGLIIRGNGRPTNYGTGPRLSPVDRKVEWVTQPEERANEWRPSHRHEAHVLNRIAEKLRRRALP